MAVTEEQKLAHLRTDPEYRAAHKKLAEEIAAKRRTLAEKFNRDRDQAHATYMARNVKINELEAHALADLNREFQAADKRLQARVRARIFRT